MRYVSGAGEFGHPDLVIIPGSKTTAADLDWLRTQGLAECIVVARRGGTPVVGICAGYQMLGEQLLDPGGVEPTRAETCGLGLLPLSTTFSGDKATHQVKARVIEGRGLLRACQGADLSAYEIHMGVTSATGLASPFLVNLRSGLSVEMPEGAADDEGLTMGTYLHGLFHNAAVRGSILGFLAERKGLEFLPAEDELDPGAEYDKLAALVRERIDMDLVYRVAGLG